MPDQPAASDCATPWTTWVRSIVNGAVGDYLQARQNGLEIDMALYVRNRPLPLTRAALLEAHPRPTARLCVFIHFDLRSQGIKDLRSPPFIEEPGHHAVPHQTVPWLTSAQHYLVVATLTEDPKHLVAILLGDGLVLVPSIPETPPDGTAPYPMTRDHIACFSRMDHLQLTRDPAVYAQIRTWCAGYERSV